MYFALLGFVIFYLNDSSWLYFIKHKNSGNYFEFRYIFTWNRHSVHALSLELNQKHIFLWFWRWCKTLFWVLNWIHVCLSKICSRNVEVQLHSLAKRNKSIWTDDEDDDLTITAGGDGDAKPAHHLQGATKSSFEILYRIFLLAHHHFHVNCEKHNPHSPTIVSLCCPDIFLVAP